MENQIRQKSDFSNNLGSFSKLAMIPKTKMNLVLSILSVALISAIVFGVAGYYFGRQSGLRSQQVLYNQQEVAASTFLPAASPTLNPTNTSVLLGKAVDYKTFFSDTIYKYKVDYPSLWKVEKGDNFVRFKDLSSNEYIQISCPRGSGKYEVELPNPKEWEPNEGGYTTKYLSKTTINGMQAVQYVWGTEQPGSDFLYTSILRKIKPIVCEVWTLTSFSESDYQSEIMKLEIYNRLLSSFEFIE